MQATRFKQFGKVAVLAGGNSRERDISLQSGAAVFKALQECGVDAVLIDTQNFDIAVLKNFDRVFIALHGVGGEDGRIQAILDSFDIPFTGSGVTASAVAMDKVLSKLIWQAKGLPIARSMVVKSVEEAAHCAQQLTYPVMVKPSLEGSSVGISLVNNAQQMTQAFNDANFEGQQVLVEQYIQGKEFSVGIVAGEVLPSVRLQTKRAFYDYQAKYIDNDTQYFCPSGLPEHEEQQIQSLALQAFSALQCSGWGRVDFMQDKQGNFYILEVNTVPGLTSHSLVPMEAKVRGYSFSELVIRILETSLKEAEGE